MSNDPPLSSLSLLLPPSLFSLFSTIMDASIVSETDAAHSSEDEDRNWLSSSAAPAQRSSLPRVDEHASASHDKLEEDTDDEIDENPPADELYCANMDDEDEVWVYKHLRGGKEEPVYVRRSQPKNDDGDEHDELMKDNDSLTSETDADKKKPSGAAPKDKGVSLPTDHMQKALLLKPRNTDAVLSCPRCFTTVCMDCQQHEKYANQYRAMFVMNIGVDWNKRIVWDESVGGLKLVPTPSHEENDAGGPDRIPHDLGHGSENENNEMYYSVHCGYCQYEVAALDMTDEIYYFFGCIASG